MRNHPARLLEIIKNNHNCDKYCCYYYFLFSLLVSRHFCVHALWPRIVRRQMIYWSERSLQITCTIVSSPCHYCPVMSWAQKKLEKVPQGRLSRYEFTGILVIMYCKPQGGLQVIGLLIAWSVYWPECHMCVNLPHLLFLKARCVRFSKQLMARKHMADNVNVNSFFPNVPQNCFTTLLLLPRDGLSAKSWRKSLKGFSCDMSSQAD